MGSVSAYFTGPKGALVMSVIAFSIVFIVISGLMLLMMLLHRCCASAEARRLKKLAEGMPENAASAPGEEDEGELIAVLTAAVSAFSGSGVRLLSFKPAKVKAPKRSGWRDMNRTHNSEGIY